MPVSLATDVVLQELIHTLLKGTTPLKTIFLHTMANNIDFKLAGPSHKERTKALYDFSEHFENIADFPQAWVHERFSKLWQMAIAHVEGEVLERGRACQSHLRESVESKYSEPAVSKHKEGMELLVHDLLIYDQLTAGGRRMLEAPSPSMYSMDQHRVFSRVNEPGARAANGELAKQYGQRGEQVPSDVAAMIHEDLAPMAQFLFERMANPVSQYLVKPAKNLSKRLPKTLISHLPTHRGEECNSADDESVDTKTIEAIANTLVYVLVTLILVAPIAIFNAVGSQTARIAVMPFFCLLLLASAHRMGPEPMRIATLATAYVQIMVIYVGTTSNQQAG